MGLLPEHDLTNTLWDKVAINLIGPWTAKTDHFNGEFSALTCIDTTTNLVERVCTDTKSSDGIARKFENTWLAQYQRLAWVIHNSDSEFTGYEFASLSCVLGIKDIVTTSKNPQFNAICEHMHQIMVTMLKTLLLSQPPQTTQAVLHLIDEGLATTMYSMRSHISKILKESPGALAFSCDMLLNIPLIVMWKTIKEISIMIIMSEKESLNTTTQSMGNLSSKLLAPLRLYTFMWMVQSLYNYRLVWWNKSTSTTLSLIETLWCNWRISYSGREWSAHEKHYTSSSNFVPGNIKVLYSPKRLLCLLSICWLLDKQSTDGTRVSEC